MSPPSTVDDRDAILDACGLPQHALRAFANERRRSILSALLDRTPPVPATDLVDAVAGATGDAASEVAAAQYHADLPKLAAADLVVVGTVDGERVVRAGPGLRRAPIGASHLSTLDAADWTALATLGASPLRRRLPAHLPADGTAVTTRALAEALAAAPEDVGGGEVVDAEGEEDARWIATALRHVHLPKLSEAGLVDRDRDGHGVSYAATDWVPLPALAAALRTDPDAALAAGPGRTAVSDGSGDRPSR